MVDSWYCLDRFVPEGISQVSRRSEVRNTTRRSLNTRPSSGTSAGSFPVSAGHAVGPQCVLLCYIKPILGNRYGPGVNPYGREPGAAGSSPFTLTSWLYRQQPCHMCFKEFYPRLSKRTLYQQVRCGELSSVWERLGLTLYWATLRLTS